MHSIRNSKSVQRALASGAVALWMFAACGDNGGDDEETGQSQSNVKPGELACGSNGCAVPAGLEGLDGTQACCKEVFAGTCGIKVGPTGECRELPKIDLRCAVPAAASEVAKGFVVYYGCCASNNECGLGLFAGSLDPSSPFLALYNSRPREACTPLRQFCDDKAPDMPFDGFMLKTCDGEPIVLGPQDCPQRDPQP